MEEERIESGCFVLRNIMNDLKRQYSVPDAIHASLVAARALAWNARRLEVACAKFEESV